MPSGELNEYMNQLPSVVELLSGNEVKLLDPEEDD